MIAHRHMKPNQKGIPLLLIILEVMALIAFVIVIIKNVFAE